ncbi:anti-sigma-I factor RsgI family protein [Lysinibacillus sphaericus]
MEIRRDVLIMMTPDGQFVNGKKVPDGHYAIGEEITFLPVKEHRRFNPGYKWKSASALLTAAILIITLFSASFIQSNKAYAYVSVDINPSLELSLNKENQVIDITPYNEDARILIENLENWKKEDVSDVTGEILRLSEKLGYLKNDQNVWITSTMTDSADSGKHSALLDDLNSFVKQYNNMHSTEIIVNETTKDLREKALKQGVTAGAFLKESVKSEQPKPVKPAGVTTDHSEGEEREDTNSPPVEKEPQASETDKDEGGPQPKKEVKTDSKQHSKDKEKGNENKSNERDKHFEPDHPSQKNRSGNNSNNGKKENGERSENRRENKSHDNDQSNREKGKGQGNSQRDQSTHNGEKQDKHKNER